MLQGSVDVPAVQVVAQMLKANTAGWLGCSTFENHNRLKGNTLLAVAQFRLMCLQTAATPILYSRTAS